MRLVVLLVAWVWSASCEGVQRGYLYPHGKGVPDQILPPQDDVSSPELFLRTPIVFYGEVYKSIFVNSNGLVSFILELPHFYNLQFPLDYPVIAPLYSNVDVRAAGSVYYRETQDEVVLERATRTIRAAFSRAREFQAKSVLVVTWLDVGYNKQGSDKLNTYQLAISSDGEDSYAELVYPDHGIQWVQGSGQGGGLADALAQVGFISGDGRMYSLKGSGSDQVRNLNEWSNVDNPGQWLFHIGQVGTDGNVEQPDLVQVEEDDAAAFCSSGSRSCHSRATCSDFESGFCCICQNGFFGNGKNCLSEAIPLRVNGKMSGTINGLTLNNLDVQAYVVPADGRSYTAISVVPPTIGYDMQSLSVLGSTIGWLFAKPVEGAVNGYQLTGGVFNQTATLRFSQTGDEVRLIQRFTGLDVFQQLTLTGLIEGTVPNIPIGSKIVIKDYEEQYTRVGLGQMIAQSSLVYQLENTGVDNRLSIDQTITFDECAGTVPAFNTMRLKVVRAFVGYEDRDSIIRYATTNKVTPLGVDDDPCREGAAKCGPQSTCVVEADSFRCVCNPGFQPDYTGDVQLVSCSDVNECETGQSNCDREAVCVNTIGSYHCQCNPGFSPEGDQCIKIITCEDVQCDQNAECIQRGSSTPICQCRSGYHGDGTFCTSESESPVTQPEAPTDGRPEVLAAQCSLYSCSCPDDYDIDESETTCTLRRPGQSQPDLDERELVEERACVEEGLQCSPAAVCVLYTRTRTAACECHPGYRGNGQDCVPLDSFGQSPEDECVSPADCVGDADCLDDPSSRRRVCMCHPGFTKDYITNTCHREQPREDDKRNPTCLEANICDANAQCVREEVSQDAVCRCNPDYEGDGFSCRPLQTGCNVLNDCAPTADCSYNEAARGYRCTCRQGYQGDGRECTAVRTCYDDPSFCGENAACLPSSYGDYSCQCNPGYIGDGKLCRSVTSRIGNFLLIAQGMAVLRVPFQPTSTDRGRPIVMQPYQQAIAIDVDCSDSRVYWSDITEGNIYSSDFTGQDIKTFIGKDIGSAEGVSVDWLSRNIFWTDSSRDTVEVASLDDSSLRKIIVSSGLVNPRGLAVHPSRGKVFWADWNRAAPKIEWANMDGTERSVFLLGPRVILPNSLAIDFSTDELCWADAGTFSIDCIGIGTRYERTLASNLSYPFGLTIAQDHYYWSDWITQKIERLTRPGQVQEKSLLPPLGSSGKLYGIAAVSDACPRLSNVCQHERGRCPEHHLCLLNGSGGRSCVCANLSCDAMAARI